jgi:hypothetical protein
MLSLRPLDERVPIQQQLGAEASPAILINVFTVAPEDVDGLLAAWEHDANWMKKQPGYISTQLHRGIAGSELCHLGIGRAFPRGFHPSGVSRRVGRVSIERRRLAASVREGGGAEFVYELARRRHSGSAQSAESGIHSHWSCRTGAAFTPAPLWLWIPGPRASLASRNDG